jgi:hypothetical protein
MILSLVPRMLLTLYTGDAGNYLRRGFTVPLSPQPEHTMYPRI